MTGNQLDEAFEHFLAGRTVPAEGATVAAFAEQVRQLGTSPGRPSPELADLLATGHLPDRVGTSAGPVVPAPAALPVAGRPRRRRRTMIGIMAAAVAKFASAGAVAHAATGVGIALAGVTGAGTAGVLPAPVQDTVASTIETISPFDLPDSGDEVDETTEGTTEETTEGTTEEITEDTTDETIDETTEGTGGTTEETSEEAGTGSFGSWVSEDARDGGVDGREVSDAARGSRQQERPSTPGTPVGDPVTSPAATQQPTAPRQADAPRSPAPERPTAARNADAGNGNAGNGTPRGGAGRP